jgi:hypothetical protein
MANDPSSSTRPAGRHDWNSDAMAGLAGAHGQAAFCVLSCLCSRHDNSQSGSVASAVIVRTFVNAVAHAWNSGTGKSTH